MREHRERQKRNLKNSYGSKTEQKPAKLKTFQFAIIPQTQKLFDGT